MKKYNILGVTRASIFSPNHIGNDGFIFNATADCLKEMGHNVTLRSEQEFLTTTQREQLVFTMLRSEASMKKLQQWEQKGTIAVNSAFGIANCGREEMTQTLIENGIPHPTSLIVNTDEPIINQLKEKEINSCWLKRGDFHAIHREDVSYARHPQEAQELLAEFALRGIKRVVINNHLKGDLIKFYGVEGSPFFYWFYPFDQSHSKFGLEKINGKAKGLPFDLNKLIAICQDSAKALKVKIFGGDCIVDEEGEIRIIDFNDWPSFAPCRKEAAKTIAECIIRTYNENE